MSLSTNEIDLNLTQALIERDQAHLKLEDDRATWRAEEKFADERNLTSTPELMVAQCTLDAALNAYWAAENQLELATETPFEAAFSGVDLTLQTLVTLARNWSLWVLPQLPEGSIQSFLREQEEVEEQLATAQAQQELARLALEKVYAAKPPEVRRTPETEQARKTALEASSAVVVLSSKLYKVQSNLAAIVVKHVLEARAGERSPEEIVPALAAKIFLMTFKK
jgi:hypothetical protein